MPVSTPPLSSLTILLRSTISLTKSPILLHLFLILLTPTFFAPRGAYAAVCHSDWAPIPTRANSSHGTHRWVGPHWWAFPAQDWYVVSGYLQAKARTGRFVSSLRCDIHPPLTSVTRQLFLMRVTLRFSTSPGSGAAAAGFRIGLQGPHDHFLSAAIDPEPDAHFDALLSSFGTLSLGHYSSPPDGVTRKSFAEFNVKRRELAVDKEGRRGSGRNGSTVGDTELTLRATRIGKGFALLVLTARRKDFERAGQKGGKPPTLTASIQKVVSLHVVRGSFGLVVHPRGSSGVSTSTSSRASSRIRDRTTSTSSTSSNSSSVRTTTTSTIVHPPLHVRQQQQQQQKSGFKHSSPTAKSFGFDSSSGNPFPHTVSFGKFTTIGANVRRFMSTKRRFGPVFWTQYTLTHNVLRLLAHVAPLHVGRTRITAELLLAGRGQYDTSRLFSKRKASVDPLSGTALFVIRRWRSDEDRRYGVRVRWWSSGTGEMEEHTWEGVIRAEPMRTKRHIRLAAFSCDHGYMFPHATMRNDVRRMKPDILFFAGDQIYETYDGVRVDPWGDPAEVQVLDFLRRWWRFGLTWRDVLRDRPSIILPDDHDVFQGNLWGGGGRRLKRYKPYKHGGYQMPARFVAAVERAHVATLPPPPRGLGLENMTLPMPMLRPYFTSFVYAGLGFAVLEDRKFKTGPLSLPWWLRRTGGRRASLLGRAQERFVRRWSRTWRRGVGNKERDEYRLQGEVMKIGLSQTMFCKATTHSGFDLKRVRTFDDSGGWPKQARNRVVQWLANSNAFTIHGDQHLGVLLKDEKTGLKSFMVPGTANGWPRALWPDGQLRFDKFVSGNFIDDAGNNLTVYAVANPERGSNTQKEKSAMTAFRKGSGFGLMVFDKKLHTVRVHLYRAGRRKFGEQFEGFPRKLHIGGRGRPAQRGRTQANERMAVMKIEDDG